MEAQHFVIETVEPGLSLGDELRLEASSAVARDRNLDLAVFGQGRPRTRPVAAVAAAPTGGIPLLVAQVLSQLRTECPLNQRFLELLEKPIFSVSSSSFV
jgi:hypothetical protein